MTVQELRDALNAMGELKDAPVLVAVARADGIETYDVTIVEAGDFVVLHTDEPRAVAQGVTYDEALRIVSDFTEGLTSESAEYERGQLEMFADMFGKPGVDTETRMNEIARDIRAMARKDAE